jgi:SAM-dependent methyltransferase
MPLYSTSAQGSACRLRPSRPLPDRRKGLAIVRPAVHNRAMNIGNSLEFFDRQFRRQVEQRDFQLNPFELEVLPHLHGRVLDFGCGLGNLAMAAAAQGCPVLALDASPTAIAALHRRAHAAARAPAIWTCSQTLPPCKNHPPGGRGSRKIHSQRPAASMAMK